VVRGEFVLHFCGTPQAWSGHPYAVADPRPILQQQKRRKRFRKDPFASVKITTKIKLRIFLRTDLLP